MQATWPTDVRTVPEAAFTVKDFQEEHEFHVARRRLGCRAELCPESLVSLAAARSIAARNFSGAMMRFSGKHGSCLRVVGEYGCLSRGQSTPVVKAPFLESSFVQAGGDTIVCRSWQLSSANVAFGRRKGDGCPCRHIVCCFPEKYVLSRGVAICLLCAFICVHV